ncbi:uncharacterized protein B4U79_04035, partial [Dinothrombium tinctorium]
PNEVSSKSDHPKRIRQRICLPPDLRKNHSESTIDALKCEEVQFNSRFSQLIEESENLEIGFNYSERSKLKQKQQKQDERIKLYESCNVNLSSVMQTNVPKPFDGSNCGSDHVSPENMPGGGSRRGVKYLSDHLQDTHQSRHFCTSSALFTSNKSAFLRYFSSSAFLLQEEKTKIVQDEKISENAQKLSSRQRLKIAVRDYGTTVIVFHVTFSLICLSFTYLLVKSGVPIDKLLDSIELSPSLSEKLKTGGPFVVAYVAYKFTAPVRIGITLVVAPALVRYLRMKGILKASKNIADKTK